MSTRITQPKWQREIENFKGIKSSFIIEGNINDNYPIYDKNDNSLNLSGFVNLDKTIIKLFDREIYDFCFCNPAVGLYDPLNRCLEKGTIEALIGQTASKLRARTDEIFGEIYEFDEISILSEIVKKALIGADDNFNRDRKPVVFVVNFASRFTSESSNMDKDEIKAFLSMMIATLNSKIYNDNINTLILVVEKFNDLPVWFYYNNPRVKTIAIPNPDRLARASYVEKEFHELYDLPNSDHVIEKLVDATDGLKLIELRELHLLYQKNKEVDVDISETVSVYKYGIKDNMWHSIDKSKISDLEDFIKERIIGQDYAVEKAVTVIKRAVMGLSGLQHSSGSNKPRGVLFLAGPTGTGKTELAKVIAQKLFGDEKNCIRFDMAEYGEPHSDQKLFGAPPGYVGYESGGQLTNKIKEKPFSVLLFDEIDKANPSIMDKFLEILEDGRMTDGQGNTVYFSESLIIFTSNYGYTEIKIDENGNEKRVWLIKPNESTYEEVRKKVVEYIKEAKAMKPEVLNRIGDYNIIVFDFIKEEYAKQIIERQIERQINKEIRKHKKIDIEVLPECYELLKEKSRADEVLINGGRGIGTLVENDYINPLAHYMFENECPADSKITVFVENDKLAFRK